MTATSTMEVGRQLAQLCREARYLEALDSLFDPDVVNVEAVPMPGGGRETRGLEALKTKCRWWLDNHEVHRNVVRGPFPHGDRFALVFDIEVTFKPEKRRMQMEEVGLYTVQDGKVVKEEFFYSMGETA